jgi:hypothetical protein
MMAIYITTAGRWDKQTTYRALQHAGPLYPFWLVVQAAEADKYRKAGYDNLVVLPPEIKRLSPTREWLAHNTPHPKLLLLDDDLRFYRRYDAGTKLRKIEPEEIRSMLYMLEEKLTDYAHVAISAREGNNHVERDFVVCGRAMRCVGYRTKEYQSLIGLSRLPVMSDFDATLQLLCKGFANWVSYEWAQNQDGGSNADGGCSVYRTKEMLADGARKLAKLYPDYVQVAERETKGSWGGGERLDVKIQWKKAWLDHLPPLLK